MKNQLWIAKFPSAHDTHDIAIWEMLVNKLAQKAGIETAHSQLKKLGEQHHIFLSKRFDRNSAGKRKHFASAMTLLQRTDGNDASNGVSYLEIVEFIMQQGAEPGADLLQLWRRIIFNICVSNTDDHLRNHGFIFSPLKGWVLSPTYETYDMNPIPTKKGLKLNISESDNS